MTERVATKIEQLEKNLREAEYSLDEHEYDMGVAERAYNTAVFMRDQAQRNYDDIEEELATLLEATGKADRDE